VRHLRVVVAGQRAFGAAALAVVRETGHEVVGVVSPHDDNDRLTRTARGTVPWVSDPVRASWRAWNGQRTVDLIVAAHSHTFISRRTRDATVLGAIGFHPSLLPLHRGRDAVRWAVHMREPITGGSVYWLTDNVDAGPLAAQDWCHVRASDTASTLWRRELFPMGLRLLRRTLDDLAHGDVVAVPQDESRATWEPSWERPPLHRPELPELGAMPDGFTLHTRDAL
jgi:methionyl-tRNA formyltransferase